MIPQFTFIRHQSDAAYKATIKKVLGRTKSFEMVRMVILLSWFSINMIVYLYFVNAASTAGYFYGQAQQEKDSAEFVYNITKLRIVRHNNNLRGTLQDSTNMETVDVNKDLVNITLSTYFASTP